MVSKNRNNKPSRQQRLKETRKKEQRLKWIRYGGLAAIVLAAFIGLVAYRQASIPEIDALSSLASENIDGPADAPIQIIEFGDFGCPSCRAWHRAGIKDQIKDRYGDQVSFVFRHFPVITFESPKAAEASQCAADQGAFWPYHDFLYERANGLGAEQLKNYAVQLGLNSDEFDVCLDSGKYTDYVNRDMRSARDVGARGTPTFLVNGQLVALPNYQNLVTLIEAGLP